MQKLSVYRTSKRSRGHRFWGRTRKSVGDLISKEDLFLNFSEALIICIDY
jgi:hypothetical protein